MTDLPTGDFVQPFLLHAPNVRGRIVRMNPVLDTILARHNYPERVARLLAELMVITAMLGAHLKSGGIVTAQVRGNGPVSLLVADITSEGAIRAVAEFNAAKVEQAKDSSFTLLLGNGSLAITLDPGVGKERYQGIVELEGQNLTDSLLTYFRQSQQLDVALKATYGWLWRKDSPSKWVGGGILIERLPGDAPEEEWNRARILMESTYDHELIDPNLEAPEVLHRLFHQEDLEIFEPIALKDECRCSRRRIQDFLATMPLETLQEMMINEIISVICQFCNREERFTLEEAQKAEKKKPAKNKPAPKRKK